MFSPCSQCEEKNIYKHCYNYSMAEDNNKTVLLDNNYTTKKGNWTNKIHFTKVLLNIVSKCAP